MNFGKAKVLGVLRLMAFDLNFDGRKEKAEALTLGSELRSPI